MLSNNFIKRFISSLIFLTVAIFFIFKNTLYLIFFLSICFLISYYEWHRLVQKKIFKFFGLIFLSFSFFSFFKVSYNDSLLIVLIVCISTDLGGYFFGKIFKGPKLTKISPNKTYAGALGAFLLSIFSIYLFGILTNFDLNFVWFLIVIMISFVSQVGDIIISYFKRLSNKKNTGQLIPGHGGILDRIDGMIFAFPFYYILELIIKLR
jgi:phosphatidate cytidylyltransferase